MNDDNLLFSEKTLGELSRQERKVLYENSLKSGKLKYFLDQIEDGRIFYESVIIIQLHNKQHKNIIGWTYLERIYWESQNINCGVFVSENFRRQGFGTKLLNAAKEKAQTLNKTIKVYPWNDISALFFTKNNLK